MLSAQLFRLAVAGTFALVASAATAKVVHIDIKNNLFVPKRIEAQVGDTIEWTNADAVGHTATAKDKSWDVILAPHKTGSMVISTAGVIPYFCRFHPNMLATLEVAAP